jgi:hypothetical protein
MRAIHEAKEGSGCNAHCEVNSAVHRFPDSGSSTSRTNRPADVASRNMS